MKTSYSTKAFGTLTTCYHRFRFYATIGGFSSKENCVSAAVNHRYHNGNLCMRRAGFASNGFQLSLACSLFIFGRIWSTRYCDDSSCWMYVFKKLIKLYRETSTVNYPAERGRRSKTGHLDGMFILCTFLISFEKSSKFTNKIPYQLIMFPFLCPVSK